jgi:hypothetical protein
MHQDEKHDAGHHDEVYHACALEAAEQKFQRVAVVEGDFEKGEADGARDSLDLVAAVARACGFGS